MAMVPDTYDMPFDRAFYYGLRPGLGPRLEGSFPENSKSFYFELTDGQHDRASTALRFKADFEKAVVVLTYFKDRQRKEKNLPCPWKPGQKFSIAIQVTRESYKIFTEGKLLAEVPHSHPPLRDVVFLRMNGDVKLERYRDPPYPPPTQAAPQGREDRV